MSENKNKFNYEDVDLNHFDIKYDIRTKEVTIESKPEFLNNYKGISLKYSYITSLAIDKKTDRFKDDAQASQAFRNSILAKLNSNKKETDNKKIDTSEFIEIDDIDFTELEDDDDFNFDEIPYITDVKTNLDDDFDFVQNPTAPASTIVNHEQTLIKAFIYHMELESDFEELEEKYLKMKCDLDYSKIYLKDLKAQFKELRKNK